MNSKIKITTLIALMLSSVSFAQTRDDGRPVSKTKPISINAKAGEQIGEDCSNSITHIASPDINNRGVMFDVEAISDVRISSLSVQLVSGFSGKVYVHRKLGTHVGSEGSPFNWLLIDSANVTESGGLTYIPIELGMNMNAGETSALYVRTENTAGQELQYANGIGIGSDLQNDGLVSLKEGTGINGTFGNAFAGRQFIGALHYCTATDVVCDTTESIFNSDNGNDGIFFDVSTDNTPITIKQFYLDFDESAEGQMSTFQIYTRPGTFDGNEASNIGWTNVSLDTIYSPIANAPVATSDELSITIPANSTQGFFLLSQGVSIDYTTGVNVGDVVSSEPNITIHTGKGTGGTFGSSLNDARSFNGVIDFCVGSSAGIADLEGSSFTISPNPANYEINVNTKLNKIESVTITDQHGKVVYETAVNDIYDLNINVSMLPPSVYFVSVQSHQSKSTKRFVKL